MANVKISDLTEFVTAEPTDVVPVVDLVNDQTKKIKIENLARASADGTAAAPGIVFSADRDTGIYRPAANQFGISTGGVSRLVIDDSGDITIGGDVTANSITFSSNLTVAGNLTVNGTTTTINSTTLQVDDKNIELGTVASATDATADGGGITLKGTTDHTIIWTDSTDSWDLSEHLNIASAKEFRIAGTKVLDATSLGSAVVSSSLTSVGTLSSLTVSGDLTVDTTTLHVDSSNDRVGIGTTSPSSKLVVEDDTFIYFDLNRTGAAAGLCRLANSGNVLDISNNVNGVTFSTGSTPSEAVRIDSNGRLGIGTTSPNKILHISGTDPIIQITDTDAGINSQIGNVGDDLYISNDFAAAGANPTIQFWNANTEVARFDNNGRLGIGTTSPVRAIHVNQSSSVIRIQDSDGTNQYAEIIHSSGGTYIDSRNNTGSGSIIFRGISGTEYARISSAGNLGVGTTSPGYKLDVNSGATSIPARIASTAVDAFLSLESSSTDLGYVRIAASGNDFAVRANNVERMRLAASGVNSFRNNSSEVARIDASGNILLGGTTTPGSATKALAIFNGTAPTGSVADGVLLYAEDVSSSSELKVRDEAGNVTTLSPHNFDLIPEGPSEDMAWSYYSEKDGKRINVDMLKAIRILEQLSGEQLVFSG